MNIIWMSWKDIGHPSAGGAETVSDQLRRHLVKDGHTVRLTTAAYPGAASRETIEGVEVIRAGGRFSVYYKAFRLYRKELKSWPDIIIDEMNTIPFGCSFYAKQRTVLLAYQLAREI